MKKLKVFLCFFLIFFPYFSAIVFLAFNERFLPEWQLPFKIIGMGVLILFILLGTLLFFASRIASQMRGHILQEYYKIKNLKGKSSAEYLLKKMWVATKYKKIPSIFEPSKWGFIFFPASFFAIKKIMKEQNVVPPGKTTEVLFLSEIESDLNVLELK